MHAKTTLAVHDTEAELFAELARVFPPQENNGTRWVSFITAGGVTVTFFASETLEGSDES